MDIGRVWIDGDTVVIEDTEGRTWAYRGAQVLHVEVVPSGCENIAIRIRDIPASAELWGVG